MFTPNAKDYIKDEKRIGSNNNLIVLKNNTYLSDILTEIPAGIVIKNHTGIGATSLELKAERNSIIVEPLKVTASLKASKNKDYLYVGSTTKNHPTKLSNEKIKEYLDNSKIKYKKIIIVADSLARLMTLMPEKQRETFFLMLDESDSFQLDSIYRTSMEECYNFYKNHSPKLRCMVTATPIKFNDPILSHEIITEFRYEITKNREIHVTYTDENYLGLCYEKIISQLALNDDEKIVLALNNVGELNSLAEKLVDEGGLNKDDIAILCGANSQEKAIGFVKQLEGETLPCKINLITSAYYTGFDIKESFHLIAVVKNQDRLNQLSTNRLKQIVGRCREPFKVLSENIVYAFKERESVNKSFKFEELLEIANTQKNVLDCMEMHLSKNVFLKNATKIIQDQFMESKDLKVYGFELVTKTETGKHEISYLAIDAILEIQENVFKLYEDKSFLVKKLIKEGHFLKEEEEYVKTTVKVDSKKKSKEDIINKIIENLKEAATIDMKLGYDSSFIENADNQLEKKANDLYFSYRNYCDKNGLAELIVNTAKESGLKGLNNLSLSILYHISDEKSPFVNAINSVFKLNNVYTTEEKHKLFKHALESIGIPIGNYNSSNASMFLNSIFDFKRNPNANESKGNVKGYKLVAHKVLDVPIKLEMSLLPDAKFAVRMFESYFS